VGCGVCDLDRGGVSLRCGRAREAMRGRREGGGGRSGRRRHDKSRKGARRGARRRNGWREVGPASARPSNRARPRGALLPPPPWNEGRAGRTTAPRTAGCSGGASGAFVFGRARGQGQLGGGGESKGSERFDRSSSRAPGGESARSARGDGSSARRCLSGVGGRDSRGLAGGRAGAKGQRFLRLVPLPIDPLTIWPSLSATLTEQGQDGQEHDHEGGGEASHFDRLVL